jgi:hypothetical protein
MVILFLGIHGKCLFESPYIDNISHKEDIIKFIIF